MVAVPLLLWTRERGPLNRNSFNHSVWKSALHTAGLRGTRTSRRLPRTSPLLCIALLGDGVSTQALADYLGHSDPAFVLRSMQPHLAQP